MNGAKLSVTVEEEEESGSEDESDVSESGDHKSTDTKTVVAPELEKVAVENPDKPKMSSKQNISQSIVTIDSQSSCSCSIHHHRIQAFRGARIREGCNRKG